MGEWGNPCGRGCKADQPFSAGDQLGVSAAGHCMALQLQATRSCHGSLEGSRRPQCHPMLMDVQALAQPWCPCLRRANARHKHFMDQGRGEQSPPLLSCLSALCKCLFVVKSRVKAPPCGRSLALAQVQVVFTPWCIQGAARPPRHPEHLEAQGGLPNQKHPVTFINLEHLVTALGTHTSLIPVNYENEGAQNTSYAFVF